MHSGNLLFAAIIFTNNIAYFPEFQKKKNNYPFLFVLLIEIFGSLYFKEKLNEEVENYNQ
jgi:hypothetical protein